MRELSATTGPGLLSLALDRGHMRIVIKLVAIALVFFAACAQANDLGDLQKYEKANPENDLKAAIARNDLRFKALMGYGLTVPGVADYNEKYSKFGVDVIKGTSDVIHSYEHGRLITIARYYAEHYNLALLQHISHVESVQLSNGLKGYAALTTKMKITQETTGLINQLPESFHAELISLTTHCVNLAWWFDPIINGKPSYNWDQFIEIYEAVNEAACQHKWIQEWVKAGPNRNAEAQIFGVRPYTETNIDFFVKTAWESAGLSSEPYYELNLRKGSEWFGTLYISKNKEMALITSLNKTDRTSKQGAGDTGKHWLDDIPQFSYHPKAEMIKYIVVDRNGKYHKQGQF